MTVRYSTPNLITSYDYYCSLKCKRYFIYFIMRNRTQGTRRNTINASVAKINAIGMMMMQKYTKLRSANDINPITDLTFIKLRI